MLKGIGAVLILCAALGYGMYRRHEIEAHVEAVEMAEHLLLMIQKNIGYTRRPLDQILTEAEMKMPSGWQRMLQGMCRQMRELDGQSGYEIWCEGLKQYQLELHLEAEELQWMMEGGKGFGSCDLNLQQAFLHLSQERLEEIYKNIWREKKEREYVSLCLSLAAGIAVILLLC